jgi:hypothetical protein
VENPVYSSFTFANCSSIGKKNPENLQPDFRYLVILVGRLWHYSIYKRAEG